MTKLEELKAACIAAEAAELAACNATCEAHNVYYAELTKHRQENSNDN